MKLLIKIAAVCMIAWVLLATGLLQVWLAFALWLIGPLLLIALFSLVAVLAWKWLRLPRAEFDRMVDLLFG